MEAKIVKTTELRSETSRILEGLRAGERYILVHYNDVVGLITPEIPKEILEKMKGKDRNVQMERDLLPKE